MWIVDTILGIAKDGIGFFRDKQKAKFQLKMAGLQNRARLLLDTESNNHEWEMKALETSGKGLKWFFFRNGQPAHQSPEQEKCPGR